MTQTVFLAYPLSKARDLYAVEHFVGVLRDQLVSGGYAVLPELGGPERIELTSGVAVSSVLSSNIAAVAGSDLVVLLVPENEEPSSIWVELGMALAAGRPAIIVGPRTARIPFLAGLSVQESPSNVRPGRRIFSAIPPDSDPDILANVIVQRVSALLG